MMKGATRGKLLCRGIGKFVDVAVMSLVIEILVEESLCF